MNSNFVKLQV